MKFEVMASVERDGERQIVPRFWVEAPNAGQARIEARQIVGVTPQTSVAVIAVDEMERGSIIIRRKVSAGL